MYFVSIADYFVHLIVGSGKMRTYSVILLLLGISMLIAVIGLLVFARPLLDSLLVAGLLAYLVDPFIQLAERRLGVKRPFAVNLVYGLTLLLLILLLVGVGSWLIDQTPALWSELQTALVEMESWLERPFLLFGLSIDPQELINTLEQSVGNALATLPGSSTNIVAELTQNLLWSLVVIVSLYYFLKDSPKMKPWIVSLLPELFQAEGRRLLDEIDTVWGVFLRMQLLIFAILGGLMIASTSLIIWLFRLGWLPLSPLGLVILLLLVYAAIQQVDNVWLRPQLLGRTLQLHPGVVFVGLIAGLALSGVLGAIIIVPLLATGRIIGRYLHARLLGQPPWPELVEPPAAPNDTPTPETAEPAPSSPLTAQNLQLREGSKDV